jgi:hypothetical protein
MRTFVQRFLLVSQRLCIHFTDNIPGREQKQSSFESFMRSTNCPLSHPRFMLLPFLSVLAPYKLNLEFLVLSNYI